MPRPNIVEESEADTFTAADWKEFVDVSRPGGSQILSAEGSEAVVVGYIPANKKRSFYLFTRGYSLADTEAPWKLRRVQPAKHPELPWLRVHTVSFDDFAPAKNPTTDTGAVGYNQPKRESVEDGWITTGTGYYLMTRVTVRFLPTEMEHWEDAQEGSGWDGKEYDRNCVKFASTEPSLELLTLSDRFIKYGESLGGGAPTGQEYPGSLHCRKTQTALQLVWDDVESSFVLDSGGFPAKLAACLGRVNKEDDCLGMGYDHHTLLLESVRMTRRVIPARTDTGTPLYSLRIELGFLYFDPEPEVGRTLALGLGHQLFPWSNESSFLGGPQWLAGVRADGGLYLESVGFEDMFTHVGS
jgi:hypothetical protein